MCNDPNYPTDSALERRKYFARKRAPREGECELVSRTLDAWSKFPLSSIVSAGLRISGFFAVA
jgi:hypothetical protein